MLNDIKQEETNKVLNEETGLNGSWKETMFACPECKKEEYVYIYDDHKTCYCASCDHEFDISDLDMMDLEETTEDRDIQERLEDIVSDDPEIVKRAADRLLESNKPNGTPTQKQLPGFLPGRYEWNKTYSSWSCTHNPSHIINGGEWGVWAGKKIDCKNFANQFDVVLNLTYNSIKEPHVIPIPELQEYEDYNCKYTEIQLDWPDYGVIALPQSFWIKLIQYLEKENKRLLVFCDGGHGRTGTALAILMCLSMDMTPEEAILWLKQNYCSQVVETEGQKAYIARMVKLDEKTLKPLHTEGIKSEDVQLEENHDDTD